MLKCVVREKSFKTSRNVVSFHPGLQCFTKVNVYMDPERKWLKK